MKLTPGLRKLGLAAHIAASVGWLGAVAAFLALAVVGLSNEEPELTRPAYFAMKWITWAIIVPGAVASLLTGVMQSLGTPWGLFRHYWVVVKLAINLLALVVMLLHTGAIEYMASVARHGIVTTAGDQPVRIQLAVTSGAAVLVLLLATGLGVYKPRGLTPWSRSGAARVAQKRN